MDVKKGKALLESKGELGTVKTLLNGHLKEQEDMLKKVEEPNGYDDAYEEGFRDALEMVLRDVNDLIHFKSI